MSTWKPKTGRDPPRPPLWTYAYQIEPAEVEERLLSVRTLLGDERIEVGEGERTWVARVVTEKRVTHILVVSDSPDRGREINRRLEAELTRLQVGFSLTAPMEVAAATRTPPEEGDAD
jgi:hypothetical protein